MRRLKPFLLFLGIITLLGYVVMPKQYVNDKGVAAKVQINTFLGALGQYKQDTGAFPTNEQGLSALRTNPGVKGWNGPYLSQDVPRDPWNRPYTYVYPGEHSDEPDITSLGPLDQQITSWKVN